MGEMEEGIEAAAAAAKVAMEEDMVDRMAWEVVKAAEAMVAATVVLSAMAAMAGMPQPCCWRHRRRHCASRWGSLQ